MCSDPKGGGAYQQGFCIIKRFGSISRSALGFIPTLTNTHYACYEHVLSFSSLNPFDDPDIQDIRL